MFLKALGNAYIYNKEPLYAVFFFFFYLTLKMDLLNGYDIK